MGSGNKGTLSFILRVKGIFWDDFEGTRYTSTSKGNLNVIYYGQQRIESEIFSGSIGPLQFTITWYKNRHAGEQIAHWDIQNKAT